MRALSRAKKFLLKGKFNFLLRFFLHEVIFIFFWRRKRNPFLFFWRKVAWENSVQKGPNFPAKSLSTCTENLLEQLFIENDQLIKL